MNTTCPNCQTEFSIPDHVYKPGRKARCAVCSQVFALPEAPGFVPQVTTEPQPAATAGPPAGLAAPAQAVPARPATQPAPQPIRPAPQPMPPSMMQQAARPQEYDASVPPVSTVPPAPSVQAQPVRQQAAQEQPAQHAPQPDRQQYTPQLQTVQYVKEPAPRPVQQPPPPPQYAPPTQPLAGQAQVSPAAAAGPMSSAPEQAYYTQQPPQQAIPQQPAHQQDFAQPVQEQSEYANQTEQTNHAWPETSEYAPEAVQEEHSEAGFSEENYQAAAEAVFEEDPDALPSSSDGGESAEFPLDWADNSGAPERGRTQSPTSPTSFDEELDALLGRTPEQPRVGEAEERWSAPTAVAPPKKSGAKKIFLGFAFLLCFAVLGFGGYLIYKSFTSGGQKAEQQKVISVEASELEKVRLLDLQSGGVEYYFVRNEKLGSLLVLEGKIVNNFPTPKSRITVEARLLNSKGVVIKSQRQICGVQLSHLQLSVLGQQELAKALNDRMQIMTYNINVQPGSEVPFMVVVVYPPLNAVEFEVTVVDASDSSEPPAGLN